jgi:uncharacterized protein YcsI (UPF0317 family)
MSNDDDTPRAWREKIRASEYHGPTSGLAAGYAQANLLILPNELADAFEEFCVKNPRACPLLERLPKGEFTVKEMAPGADVRIDLPRYHVFAGDHLLCETDKLTASQTHEEFWSTDLTAFLLGCSFTFEWALKQEGVPLYHQEQNKNVAMYKTNIPLRPVANFGGNMVVSMRYVPLAKVELATRVTSRFPRMHGRPIHIGDPRAIGIKELDKPNFGEPTKRPPGTVPMFWACGVSSQTAVLKAQPRRAITHAPGHMLILDKKNEDFDESKVPSGTA